MRRVALGLLLAVVVAIPLYAGIRADTISATATVTTVTEVQPFTAFQIDAATGGDTCEFVLYDCETCGGQAGRDGGQGVACTDAEYGTTNNVPLVAGPENGLSFGFDERTERGRGYCGFSIDCDTGESATIYVRYK